LKFEAIQDLEILDYRNVLPIRVYREKNGGYRDIKKNVVLSFEPKENFDLTENTDTIKIGRQNIKQHSPFFPTSGSYQCTFEASAPPAGGCKFSTLQTTR
jgi:hypothetical protein